MKINKFYRSLVLTLGVATLLASSFQASPEDIDIFTVDENSTVAKPNVLIVLDNTSNWSRQSQQWPGGEQQGQSEVAAIKTAIAALDDSINVGLMEYVTGGNANDDGGFVRYHIRPMNSANKTAFGAVLDTIYGSINSPTEKRNSNTAYGNLIYDVYNYLSGGAAFNSGAGTPSSTADTAGYTANYSNFRSPLTSLDSCGRTIVIFIGNADSSGPVADSTSNGTTLQALGGSTSQINFADFTAVTSTTATDIARTSVCYADAAACLAAENTACTAAGYTNCSCISPLSCSLTHYSATGRNTATTTTVTSDSTDGGVANQYTGEAIQCSKNSPGSYTCPAASTSTVTSGSQNTATTISWSGCSYVESTTNCGQGNSGKHNWEPRGTKTTRTVISQTTTNTTTTPLSETAACYDNVTSCTAGFTESTCPSATYNSGCACVAATNTTGCGAGSTRTFMVHGTHTATTLTATGTFSAPPSGPFMLDEWTRFLRQTGVPIGGSTTLKSQVTTYTVDVFNAQQNATQSALLFNAARVGGGKYFQARNKDSLVNALRQIFTEVQAVNTAFSSASLPVNATNRAQNANQVYIGLFKPDRTKDPLWFGNMKRYKLIENNAGVLLGDFNGNAAINNLTGFIGDCAQSWWTTDSGNYWFQQTTDDPDALGICGTSSFNVHSDSPDGPFVEKGSAAEVIRKGNDPSATADGNGNYSLNRTIKTLSGGTLVDFTSTTIVDSAKTTEENALIANFIRGADTNNEDFDSSTAETRSTIHGDVVHSRPQPVSYAGTFNDVVIYYGANDGTYRAVKASTGQEMWSFVAPEHFSKLERLRANTPIVSFGGSTSGGAQAKDYFFDGSTGLYQTSGTNSIAWIFPTMRRGGRKVYAFNVTNPAAPVYLWSKGCPNLTGTTGCDTGFTTIGQTWSIPAVAFIKGYSTGTSPVVYKPVVIIGGGYDACEDANTATPSCTGANGRGVYVLDAETGALLKHFDFSSITGSRSIASDVSLIDVDQDGKVDYAYAADLGGNIYRMDFIDGPTTKVPLSQSNWTSARIASVSGGGRGKFMFQPALIQATANIVYLAIGTGDREHPLLTQYPYTDVLNRFYVFKNDLSSTASINLDSMTNAASNGTCDAPKVLPSSTESGWYLGLSAGEQVVTSALIAGGTVFFSTNRPTLPSTAACSTSLGEARGYIVNLLNGSGAIGVSGICGGDRSTTFIGGGLPPSPVLATVPIGEGDNLKIRTVVIGGAQKSGDPSSAIEAQRVTPTINSRRRPVYWYKSTDTD